MNGKTKPAGDGKKRRAAKSKNIFTTKNGTAIKLNRSLGERMKANREARARKKAAYLATLPKNPFKRFLFRIHPRQVIRYWFSREGGIMALKIMGVGLVVSFVLIVGVFAYFRKDLPNIKDLAGQTLGGSVVYRDREDKVTLWQDYNEIKRQPVATDHISKYVRNATVAIEDKDFYQHGAFDVRGILRAAVNNVTGGSTQGASTISQQLAKLDQQWTAERTVGNKVKELILAIEMEREYSKDDILTGYLNLAPYGPVSYGVQVAAQDYFGIDAKDLTLEQSVMLAAIPQAPSLYSPYGPRYDSGALTGRMHYILDQMVAQKMVTKDEATVAKGVDVLATVKAKQPSLYTGIKAPSFVQAAKEELVEQFGNEVVQRGGWKVITTVDMKLQDLAQKSVNDGMPQVRKQGGDTAAFVAIDNATGQVVALVGNGDNDIVANQEFGELNFGNELYVSPGSTFKPYDYAAFIENNNAGAGSVLYDSRGALPGYPCTSDNNCLRDYDRVYPGPLTLRYALAGSRNVPAVKAMLSAVPNDSSNGRIASVNKTIGMTESMMGLTEHETKKYWCFYPNTDVYTASVDNKYRDENQTQCGGSSAIGDGAYLKLDDHATGLSTFARLGQHMPHTYILKITDSANKTIVEFKQPTPKQVIKPDTAYIINDMLTDPRASYLGSAFHNYNGWKFAIKTGTTNDSFDGLMASWSTKYTAATWVGWHTRNKAMSGFMENMTRPIMRSWMQGAHNGLQPVNWDKPSGVKTLPAFVVKDKIGNSSAKMPSSDTDVYPSWYKQPDGSTAQTMDLVSNKTATDCTPDLARSSSAHGGSNTSLFLADIFMGATNNSTTEQTNGAVDDIHNCNDDKPSALLTEQYSGSSCEVGDNCEFNVFASKGTHPLSGGAYTTSPAGTLDVILNGQTVKSFTISDNSPNSFNEEIDLGELVTSAGTYTFQVRIVDSVLYSYTSGTETVTFTN